MGTFAGHILPGTFLFILGTWWSFGAWRNYVRCKQRNRRYSCRAWYAVPGISRRICWEGVTKIVTCSIGIVGEVVTAFDDGRFAHMGNSQHVSMYLFYLISGIVDVMTNNRFPFPPGTDYVTLLFAVTVEGLLFHFHLHGRPHLDVLIHTLLVYVVVAQAACIIVEMNKPRSILASLGRAFFCLLQGTWFWQVGFILYSPLPGPPSWDVHSHDDMMLATTVFTWHIVGVLAFLAAMGAVVLVTCNACDCDDPAPEGNGTHYSLVPGSEAKADIHMGAGDPHPPTHPTHIDYSDDDLFP